MRETSKQVGCQLMLALGKVEEGRGEDKLMPDDWLD